MKKTITKKQLQQLVEKKVNAIWNKSLNETMSNKTNDSWLIENIVRKELLKLKALNENLYTDDIDTSDLRVYVEPYNEDGYCEWEATCDNGWYTFRGTYAKRDCELEDCISGHSGHGQQHTVNDQLRDWFYDNLYDRVVSEIEEQSSLSESEDYGSFRTYDDEYDSDYSELANDPRHKQQVRTTRVNQRWKEAGSPKHVSKGYFDY